MLSILSQLLQAKVEKLRKLLRELSFNSFSVASKYMGIIAFLYPYGDLSILSQLLPKYLSLR